MNENNIFQQRIDLTELNLAAANIRNEISQVIVGQNKMIEHFLVAILANGHILIEGVPGVAKTLTAKLMAKTLSVNFSRIQFTPDLMPSDVLGTSVFHLSKSEFEFNKGPIFSNIVLIDEINRSPAKTQAALFEVMEERQITVDGKTYVMEKPFLVFATQNPIEHEGTYRLPEAQLDRFLFKIVVKYPSVEEEIQILTNYHENKGAKEIDKVKPILSAAELLKFQELVKTIHIDENLRKYIAQFTTKTRTNPAIYLGASPRASLAIMTTAKAFAAIQGRDFVNVDDIREMILPVLRHRILLTPEKEMEGVTIEEIIKQILFSIEIPR